MEELKKILEADVYFQPRGKPTEAELRLFLREVDYHCPLCGKELQSRKQKKTSEKKFQIAHIYPNSPTLEQWNTLTGFERLGESTESFENKIALCKDCHGTQDFHTTREEYLRLMEIKKNCLRQTALHDSTLTLGLESEIESVINRISKLNETDIAELNYEAIAIANKFIPNEMLLKTKITGYVMNYFTYIRDLFKNMEKSSDFNFNILSGQIRACFIKMDSLRANKFEIFESMVDWVNNRTQNISRFACEELKVYQKAQKYNFIANIGKRDLSKNEKELEKLNKELEELANDVEKGFADLDAQISEEAIRVKKLLSRTRRLRSGVKSRLETINENAEYKFSATAKDFQSLLTYFPDVNIRKIEDIEGFHSKISSVFKGELDLEKRKLEKDLLDYNDLVNQYEEQLKALIKNPKLSKTVLSRHSELLRQINYLKKENESYTEWSRLRNNKKDDEGRLATVKQKQFAVLASEFNAKMDSINQFIYDEKYNSPVIDFSDNSYSFFTPDDTGTGVAYKGLVVFDLAVLELTRLPIVVHDSIVLKQISDTAIERILELYENSGKQVIIALDKQDSYTEKANKILNGKAVLRLAPNGNELFGRSWG